MSVTEKTAIKNVRVFNGTDLSELTTVVIQGYQIVSDGSGARELDGDGGVLLPGLIDAHVHFTHRDQLHQLARAGVTTALDMACWPPSFVESLRNQKGVTDIRSAGTPLTAPGSVHSRMPGIPGDALVVGASQAVDFVNARIAEGSDYVKLVADIPGPDQDTLNTASSEAKKHGKLVIAHAAGYEPVRMAQNAKVDVLTHAPLDKAITREDAKRMLDEGRICVPTLAMMEGVARLNRPGTDYSNCRESVTVMHNAGVPILAGTDANAAPGSPSPIRHGESLHRELELLVEAGLSTVEALNAATSTAARHFKLHDRGVIEPGKRADLVLIPNDPIEDIKAIRRIEKVWCGGVEVW